MIGPPERDILQRFIPAEAQRHGATVVTCGMVNDHVHILLMVRASWDLPRIMQGLKGGSARVLNQNADRSGRLKWAPGYNAKSVSPGVVPTVINYIKNQPNHHPERRIPE